MTSVTIPDSVISTHPPREGRDRAIMRDGVIDVVFQPTRPVRGGTGELKNHGHDASVFQPTRPVRGGTR